jgi:hypothetical protein
MQVDTLSTVDSLEAGQLLMCMLLLVIVEDIPRMHSDE